MRLIIPDYVIFGCGLKFFIGVDLNSQFPCWWHYVKIDRKSRSTPS